MELGIRIRMNDKLFLRNPEDSVLGRKIIKQGAFLINKIGFEEFTFKKLSQEIGTTEASIYRYFENKHKLLLYFFSWYWSYLEYRVVFATQNITDSESKLKSMIRILVAEPEEKEGDMDLLSGLDLYKLIQWEGSKAYLTRQVNKDNKDRLFKPYKDLCELFASMIKEHAPKYKYPHSLASTIIEMAHMQKFFSTNLPSLTDFLKDKEAKKLISFLESLLFNALM